ncbi:MAG: NYN domain-containing protein [Alphaproteobacteria bacterium]|nr:NYN domain-containing protein [Alphaproteobacteria bacterium]MCZ6838493.1 NYN domain-containing protein [Alphaproteobacteria bacterium]
MFYNNERIAVFIDGANLYATAKALDFDIDYKKLLALFKSKATLVRAYYYTVLIEDQEYSPIRPLVDWLDYNGYTLITKPAKEFTDSSGRRRIRNSIDVELAVDVMEIAGKVDHVVLLTGDGGYRRLIEAVQRQGTRVTIISTVSVSPPMAADEIRRQADNFVDLASLRGEISRQHSGARPARNDDDYEDGDDDYEDDFDDEDSYEDDEIAETA